MLPSGIHQRVWASLSMASSGFGVGINTVQLHSSGSVRLQDLTVAEIKRSAQIAHVDFACSLPQGAFGQLSTGRSSAGSEV